MIRAAAVPALAIAGLLLAGSASQEKMPHALVGRVAAAPVSCIDPGQGDGPTIVDARTILYRDAGHVWVTGPSDSCPALRPTATLVIEGSARRLCRDDRFAVLEPGSRFASAHCRFASFTPWVKATP